MSVIIEASSKDDALFTIKAQPEMNGKGFVLKHAMVNPNYVKHWAEVQLEMTKASTKGLDDEVKVQETGSTIFIESFLVSIA